MADKENNHVDVPFTYDAPDDYLYQTNALGKTGNWTYNGPDKIWILVDKESKKYAGRFITEKEDGEHYPTPLDQYKVLVDCTTNPLLCTLVGADEIRDYNLLDQFEEELPDGNVYKRPHTPPPDHTYELMEITYNPTTGDFDKPYPWKKPHSDWEMVRMWRNNALTANDYRAPADAPESVKAAWEQYRQELRDLPQVYGAVNTHVTLDLTAASPINTVGQKVIKVTDVTGIDEGFDVGVKGHPVTDIFEMTTKVVSIDRRKKQITLDKALIATPTDANSELAFSPPPGYDAWKAHMPKAPDGSS